MEQHVKSGELLLALSITCRKLQTEAEKVILGGEVFDDTEVEVNENFKLQTLNLKDHVDISEEELVELNKSLRNFWRRQAMAEAQNLLMLERAFSGGLNYPERNRIELKCLRVFPEFRSYKQPREPSFERQLRKSVSRVGASDAAPKPKKRVARKS